MARGRKKVEEVVEVQDQVVEQEVQTQEEEVTMSEQVEKQEVQVEAVEEVKPTFISDTTGKTISRSAYIRQEFLKNRSRGDIAKELGCAYGIVYSATANMENEVHKATEGASAARGVIMTHPETGAQISRAEYCREQVEAGKSRGALAKELGIAYATVYAATKDLKAEGGGTFGGTRVFVEVDGNAKPRSEFIREEFLAGKTRREIANEIGCDYAVVWAATKTLKETEEEVVAAETTEESAE